MSEELILIAITVGACVVLTAGAFVLVWKCYRRVEPHEALVIHTTSGSRVARQGAIVFPILHKAETVDLSIKTLRFARRGRDAVATRDDRAELDVVVSLRVNATDEDILAVATRIGCKRSYDARAIEELFGARITSAIATVARQLTYEEIGRLRDEAEDRIIEVIGADLDGFFLDHVAIERVERVPPEQAGPFR